MLQTIAVRVMSRWADNDRTLNVYKNILLSFFLKGASIVVSFLVIPITLNYVNTENFGIWMTVSSLTLWFGLIDVSFGNGLRNQLVKSFANSDFELSRSLLSTLYVTLIVGAVLLSIIIYIFNIYIDWGAFFHAKHASEAIISHVITLMLVSFSVQIALKPINALLLADQRASMTSWLLLLGNILSLIGIYIASRFTVGSLLTLAYIQSIAPVIVLLIANIWFFTTRYRHISPSIKYIRFDLSDQLFNAGGKFLFLQIVSVLMFSSGNLIITYFIDSEHVTLYSIANRYFGVIPLLYGIVITPYWSAFTEAYIKKDYDWIWNTLRKLNRLACLSIVAAIVMIQLADIAYAQWIGTELKIPMSLSISLGIYAISYSFLCNYNYLINGIGKLKLLVIASLVGIVIFIPLNYFFIVVLNMGLPGVVWVSIIWNVSLLFICRMQASKLLSGEATGIWNS